MSIILALGRLKQEDQKIEASLGYIASSRPALEIARPYFREREREREREFIRVALVMIFLHCALLS
jgi:hypothetical protein